MLKKRWFRIAAIVCAVLMLLAAVGGVWICFYSVEQNKTIIVTAYTVSHADIPASFEGKRIVQLTDLHNKDFGDQLTELVKAQDPDIIVITGDWISRDSTDITAAKQQAKALVGIAPIYYVTGNHEAASALWKELLSCFEMLGITVLYNHAVEWTEHGDRIQLIGMFDQDFDYDFDKTLQSLVDKDLYSILLLHRPEYLKRVARCDVQLQLSGHTHGGQIRLPLIGAVYAPNQGFFPQYDVGRYEQENTTMILSQGLGESDYMRILTPPELVVVTLDSPNV